MRIGIEVEFTGISRRDAVCELMKLWSIPYDIEKYSYKEETRTRYVIKDREGLKWSIVLDRSIHPVVSNGKASLEMDEYMCEIVSPVLDSEYESDINKFASVLNAIRCAGAIVNETCGIHIHVDCPEDLKELYTMFSRFMNMQRNLQVEFGIPKYRLEGYCKEYSENLCNWFKDKKFGTLEEFQHFFYNWLAPNVSRDDPKNPARYYMINMDSIHKLGTVEFRFFNSTLSPLVLKSYIAWLEGFISYVKEKASES